MVGVCGIDFSAGQPSVLHSKADGEVTKSHTMVGSRFILMQYTGLKDKNGKEIYEGDVGVDGENDAYYEVVFDEGAFVSHYDGNITEYLSETASQMEIIGNIFENPELLQE